MGRRPATRAKTPHRKKAALRVERGRVHVVLAGRKTPVFLTDVGPRLREVNVAAFEERFGETLPADYREFLLRYNGGEPVVGDFTGEDDDPSVPYRHGDMVQIFYKLARSKADSAVALYEDLARAQITTWNIPRSVLLIAEDPGGNAIALDLREGQPKLRFVNHERLDEPLERHRVVAYGFLDFLLRFRTLEDAARLAQLEKDAERATLANGPLPEGVEAQCRSVATRHSAVRSWIRTAFLAVFEKKGFFAVHDDPESRDVLDLMLWLALQTDHADGLGVAVMHEIVLTTWKSRSGSLGFSGYAPGFVDDWWRNRVKGRALIGKDEVKALSPKAAAAIIAKWSRARS